MTVAKKSGSLVEMLNKPLNPDVLKVMDAGGGKEFKYIPYRIILDQANNIFGPDGWSAKYEETVKNIDINMPVWDYAEKKKIPKDMNYTIVSVRVLVAAQYEDKTMTRTATGHVCMTTEGYVKSVDTVHAKAMARADKSAFKKFGPAFGLGLIQDEEENELAREDETRLEQNIQKAKEELKEESIIDRIMNCKTNEELIKTAKIFKKLEPTLTEKERTETRAIIKAKGEEITELAAKKAVAKEE